MKYITITLATAVIMASCHFDSDKDYKKFDKDSTAQESGAHDEHGAGSLQHGAGPSDHGAAGTDSTDAPGLHSATPHAPDASIKNPTDKLDSVSNGRPGIGLNNPGARKARATMSDWNTDNSAAKEMDAEGIYANADVMPEYPGGKKAIQKFIEDNIKYPQEAIDGDIQGTVQISFAVDENGNVYKASSNGKPLGHGLEQEALRVVKKMPKWKPGKVNGKSVKTRLSLPVVFLIS